MPPRRTPRTPPVPADAELRVLLAALLAGDENLELTDPLDTLAVDTAIAQRLAAREHSLVTRAVAAGASYTDVGDILGIHRVTAHNRYAAKEPRPC